MTLELGEFILAAGASIAMLGAAYTTIMVDMGNNKAEGREPPTGLYILVIGLALGAICAMFGMGVVS